MVATYILQYTALYTWLAALLYSAKRIPILYYSLLFIPFAFIYVAFDVSKTQSTFYILGLVFAILIKTILGKKYQQESSGGDLNGSAPGGKIAGFTHNLWSVAVACMIWFVAKLLSAGAQAQIIGTPQLAIGGGQAVLDKIFLFISPIISGTLGIIENNLFLGILMSLIIGKEIYAILFTVIGNSIITFSKAISTIPYIGMISMIPACLGSGLVWIGMSASIVMPYITIMFLFGLFHVTAYLLAVGTMVWAGMMMGAMIVSYYITFKDMTAMDLFHFNWNGTDTIKDTLTIVR